MSKIPGKFKVGGTSIVIANPEYIDDGVLGMCHLNEGFIEIANTFRMNHPQSSDSKVNTFYHELVHAILDTMGELDLSRDEKFVNCFAGFLTEALTTAGVEYNEENCR